MKKKWDKMSEKKKNTLEIIVALLITASFFTYRICSNYFKAQKEAEISREVHLVTNDSRYFTVINCIEKYLNTVQSGNKSNILLTLDSDYKSVYNITDKNISNYIPNLSKGVMYSYKGQEMYEKRVSKNVVEYYVYGSIKGEIMDEASTNLEYNVTVILYESEFLFSIRPGVNYEK